MDKKTAVTWLIPVQFVLGVLYWAYFVHASGSVIPFGIELLLLVSDGMVSVILWLLRSLI